MSSIRGNGLDNIIYNLSDLAELLLPWYREVRRSLPWREDPTPYHVWISEIMLQQTRIEAVLGYYRRFLEAFPGIPELASAEEEQVLKMWEGLGYYSRVRNLRKAAIICVESYGGAMPADYESLKNLPGIGSYTAGAVASIAFGLPEPAVDGNVLRVITRYTADASDITKDAVKRRVEQELRQVLPKGAAGEFNQALMELGERVCIPNGKALCESCPLREHCQAYLKDEVDVYPVRTPKKQRKMQQMTVLLLECRGRYAIRRRPAQGLLAGLYEFPWLEGWKDEHEMLAWLEERQRFGHPEKLRDASHVFTHIEWHMRGWRICTEEEIPGDWHYETVEEIHRSYPVPTAMKKYDMYLAQ